MYYHEEDRTGDFLSMIEDCEMMGRLTEWETNFLDSIKNRLEAGTPLTEKQEDTLEQIWGWVTDKEHHK